MKSRIFTRWEKRRDEERDKDGRKESSCTSTHLYIALTSPLTMCLLRPTLSPLDSPSPPVILRSLPGKGFICTPPHPSQRGRWHSKDGARASLSLLFSRETGKTGEETRVRRRVNQRMNQQGVCVAFSGVWCTMEAVISLSTVVAGICRRRHHQGIGWGRMQRRLCMSL